MANFIWYLIASFATSFLITYIAIPSIIKVAKLKNLFDEPGFRKSHFSNIPTLGGLAVFMGMIFSITFWTDSAYLPELQYIISAIIIIFFIGIKDDIIAIDPIKKLGIQVVSALILIYWGGIKLTGLYGIFGIYVLPEWVQVLLTLFTIIVIINAFNLIDGIDGLLGAIGIIISVTFCITFYLMGDIQFAIIALSLAGALCAFLRYNITPAKIFMGDTGSLLVGLVSSILAIKFVEMNNEQDIYLHFKSAPAIAFGILIIPLFDTLRVFLIRVVKGKSPFHGDRNHVHHLLVDLKLTHTQASIVLALVNLVFINIAFACQSLGSFYLLILILATATTATVLLGVVKNRKVANSEAKV